MSWTVDNLHVGCHCGKMADIVLLIDDDGYGRANFVCEECATEMIITRWEVDGCAHMQIHMQVMLGASYAD